MLGLMSEVTRILSAIEQGDPHAAEQLLPLVYDELRKLAAQRLAQETPGQTLQATGLVHEAYLRLVDVEQAQHWNSRAHFFAAAAKAMRRILIENARSKDRLKHGGGDAEGRTPRRGLPAARGRRPRPGRGLEQTPRPRPDRGPGGRAAPLRRAGPRGHRWPARHHGLPGPTEMDLCPRLAAECPRRIIFHFFSTAPRADLALKGEKKWRATPCRSIPSEFRLSFSPPLN